MKRTVTAMLVATVLVVGIVGAGTTAIGSPSKSKSCTASGCHKATTKVKVTLTKKSSTKTTVTYTIRVSGGSGTAGWGLYRGTKNVKHRTSSTGTVTLTKGKTYIVRGVMKKTGCGRRTITPR